jgi:hypothetical protein
MNFYQWSWNYELIISLSVNRLLINCTSHWRIISRFVQSRRKYRFFFQEMSHFGFWKKGNMLKSPSQKFVKCSEQGTCKFLMLWSRVCWLWTRKVAYILLVSAIQFLCRSDRSYHQLLFQIFMSYWNWAYNFGHISRLLFLHCMFPALFYRFGIKWNTWHKCMLKFS